VGSREGGPCVYVVEPTSGLEDWPRHRERGVRAIRAGLEGKRQVGMGKIID